MDDNWNELMERETQQFQADMQRETIDELTAENAKLRAELAEAVGLLKNIGDYACKMVKLLQEEPPAPQYAIRRWGRIVDFVAKHTTAV